MSKLSRISAVDRLRRFLGLLGLASVLAGAAALSPSVAQARSSAATSSSVVTRVSTVTLGFRGYEQKAVAPAAANVALVTMTGGRGGSPTACGRQSSAPPGGDGAEVSGRFAVTSGETVVVDVGGRGANAEGDDHPGSGGWGATGLLGGSGGTSPTNAGGGGGGATSVGIGGERLMIAGGGGGAGGGGYDCSNGSGGAGGNGGATAGSGQDGGIVAGRGGRGGARETGGGGDGANGSRLNSGGGGGGAGAKGGDGGDVRLSGAGGGGGAGSSVTSARVDLPHFSQATGTEGNGLVTITWERITQPVCSAKQVNVPYDSSGVAFSVQCLEPVRAGSYRVLAEPRHGKLVSADLTDGKFTYVPDQGFSGIDTLIFQGVAAGQSSAPAAVSFVVARRCVDQTVHVPAFTEVRVQLNCSPTNERGRVHVTRLPGHGGISNLIGSSTSFTYRGLPGFSGVDSIQYAETDRGYSSVPATITFIVGDLPYPTCPDGRLPYVQPGGARIALSCPKMTGPLTYRITALPQHGHLVDLDLAKGLARYVPDPGFLGEDSMAFQAFGADGQVSASFRLTAIVTHPQAPMTLRVEPSRFDYGHSPTLTVTLPKDTTGDVGFYDAEQGGLGTAEIVDGVATLNHLTKHLTVGEHTIQASFGGNDKWAANDSNVVHVTVVGLPKPSMVLSVNPPAVTEGQSPELTLRMPASVTGRATFYDAQQGDLGSAEIVNGVARITHLTKTLTAGEHFIEARYPGDDVWGAHDSNPVYLLVKR